MSKGDTYPIQSPINRTYQNNSSMYTSYGSKQKEIGKVSMVEMSTTCVNPRTVVVHLYHTSEKNIKCNCYDYNISNISKMKLSMTLCYKMLIIVPFKLYSFLLNCTSTFYYFQLYMFSLLAICVLKTFFLKTTFSHLRKCSIENHWYTCNE